MNRTGNCVLLTTTFLLLTACGGGSGDQPVSESKSPQSAAPAEKPQKPATPADLGRAVADALIANDLDGFLAVCLSVEDRADLINASTYPDEKKQKFLTGLEKERDMINERLKSDFSQVAGQTNWSEAVIDTVEAGEPNVESDIPRCPSIRVVFKDGAKLLIEGAHETSSGWGVDEGIKFFSAP